MAPLCYTAKFDPSLSVDCARVKGGRDQILQSGNLVLNPAVNPDSSGGEERGGGGEARSANLILVIRRTPNIARTNPTNNHSSSHPTSALVT